jgi:hypothetical protein
MRELASRDVHHRVKGRRAVEKRLRGVLLAVHRFGPLSRVQPGRHAVVRQDDRCVDGGAQCGRRGEVMGKRPNGRKPGRPVDPVLEELRSVWLPTRSARTHARYKAAVARLILVG